MLANHSQEWEFDLQLFAEDGDSGAGPAEGSTLADQKDNGNGETSESGDASTTETDEEEFEVVYNKEKVKVKKSEAPTYIQKGMNYDKVKTKAESFESALQRRMKLDGFDNIDDYLKAVEQAEKSHEAKDYATKNNMSEEAAQRLLEVEKKLNERDKQDSVRELQQRIADQKKELKGKPYFSDLEADIDQIVEENVAAGRPVDVETVFNYLRGKNLESLMEKDRVRTKQSTIADVHDRARRGSPIANDGGGGDDVDVSDVDMEMARAFGNDPKEIARYKKQNLKRS